MMNILNINKFKKYAPLIILISLLAEIYFYPFKSEFKISAGIIALDIIILIMDNISEINISLLSGLAVFAVRSAALIISGRMSLAKAAPFNFPSLFYYVTYGILAKILKIRKKRESTIWAILSLSLVDFTSNLTEAFLRGDISLNGAKLLLLTAITRSLIAYFIYELDRRNKLFILSAEHQKRYTLLNMLISNIQSEMFYLQKSMKDIENVMSKSYDLYKNKGLTGELKQQALDIAREVHEIKKDYYRVTKGFESFIKNLEDEDSMKLSNIITIIKDNVERYLQTAHKDIIISFKFEKDFAVGPYYNMFTILNNLITNSIDACTNGDRINVMVKVEQGYIVFEVSDTGEGIEEDILPYIFNPGFTTKYDEKTGKASTGIGLSHVKNIVEDLGGNVELHSVPKRGTKFKIKLPEKNILR